MHGLVITPFPPPRRNASFEGVLRRLRIFLWAIAEVCDRITTLHFVDSEFMRTADWDALAAAQGEFDTPIQFTFAPRNDQWRRWQLALAPFSIQHNGDYNPFFGKEQISTIKNRLSLNPDFIFAHRFPTMCILGHVNDLPPIYFDLDDIEHVYKLRSAAQAPSAIQKLSRLSQIPTIIQAERRAIRLSKKTFLCSLADQSRLTALGMGSKTIVIPNAVEVPTQVMPVSPERTVLYLGNYAYPPNVLAAERLITRIWPLILQGVETARLIIAGNQPELIPAYHLRPANVEFTGLVHELACLYRRSRVICCPILWGSGTRLKLIEAAAYAKPMVSTRIGAEGLLFEDGSEILIRETDKQIADACCRLLVDDVECLDLGTNAYRRARSVYDANSVKNQIKYHILEMQAGRGTSAHDA